MLLIVSSTVLLVTLALVVAVIYHATRPKGDPNASALFSFCGLIVDRPGIYGNTLITGEVGCGKIMGGLKPALTEILNGASSTALGTVGGLVLDGKGDLAEFVSRLAGSIPVIHPGIDVRLVAPGAIGGETECINLLCPSASAAQTAALLSGLCLRNLDRPIDNSTNTRNLTNFLEACLMGLRLKNPERDVTLADLCELVEGSETRFGELTRALPSTATVPLHYFNVVWPGITPSRKTAITRSFLDRFGEFAQTPSLREQFSGKSTFDFSACVASNQCVLFYTAPAFGHLNGLIGTMLKARFQSEVMALFSSDSVSPPSREHSVLLVGDDMASYIGDVEQETQWLTLSRSMQVINLWTLNSDDWLSAYVGVQNETTLLHQFANRVWFSNTSTRTNERAEKICGLALSMKETPTTTAATPAVSAEAFKDLEPLECISFGQCAGRVAVRRYKHDGRTRVGEAVAA